MTKETAMAVAAELKVARRLVLPPSSSTHVPPEDYDDDADEDEEVEPEF